MPVLLEVVGPRAGPAPLTYLITEAGTFDLQSVFAHFDGSGASGAFRPVVTIKAQNGTIIVRVFPSTTLAAGDTADVTYAPFLGGDESVVDAIAPPGGCATYVALVGLYAPRAYYRLNETAGLPQDTSGNGRHMTGVIGAPVAAGSAPLNCPGSIEYTNDAHTRVSIGGGGTGPTVTFWVYRLSAAAQQVFANALAPGTNGLTIDIDAAGKLFVICQGVAILASSSGSVAVGAWTHVGVVREGGVWKYYLNGVLDTPNAGTAVMAAPGGVTGVGAYSTTTDIRLAHVAWYDSALNSAAMAQLYSAAF